MSTPVGSQLLMARKQVSLSNDKAYAFLVCLLHYNLSIVHTIHFLGNKYTSAYHDIPSIIESLHAHGIAKSLIAHYSYVMTVGCPNLFNVTITHDKGQPPIYPCQDWPGHGHHEQGRTEQLRCSHPTWLWQFMPHSFITSQHILKNPGQEGLPAL